MKSKVKSLLSNQGTLAWIVWSVSAVFLLFQFFLQLSSADIVGGLMDSFTLSAFGASVLASTYYYIYVSLQAPAGILIDRLGPRRLLASGALVCAGGCWLFATAKLLLIAVLGRLLMGGGAAFAFVGSLSLISRWFPISRFALMVAVAETIGMFGAVFGGTLLAHLVIHFGWRASIQGAAVLAAMIAVLLWAIVRDTPPNSVPVPLPETNFWQDLKMLTNKKVAWINGAYSGLMFAVQTVFIALWGVQFLQTSHHLSLTMAALICNLVFIGVCFGGPVLAWLDSHFPWRKQITCYTALCAMVLISMVIYLPGLPLWIVGILMLLLGFVGSSYVLTFAIANEIAPAYMRSTSVGFVNMLSVGSGPILQPLAGLLLLISSHHGVDYTVGEYQIALSILPICLLLAAWCSRYLPVFRPSLRAPEDQSNT
ncbi:MAG: MFS transporter [Proteobacteria bacterium]|nr:MFS transporter [Pseudomonadota bacterium]